MINRLIEGTVLRGETTYKATSVADNYLDGIVVTMARWVRHNLKL